MDSQHEKSTYFWLPANLQLVHPSEIPSIVVNMQERLQNSIVKQWRQTITGDPNRYEKQSCLSFHVLKVSAEHSDLTQFLGLKVPAELDLTQFYDLKVSSSETVLTQFSF